LLAHVLQKTVWFMDFAASSFAPTDEEKEEELMELRSLLQTELALA